MSGGQRDEMHRDRTFSFVVVLGGMARVLYFILTSTSAALTASTPMPSGSPVSPLPSSEALNSDDRAVSAAPPPATTSGRSTANVSTLTADSRPLLRASPATLECALISPS